MLKVKLKGYGGLGKLKDICLRWDVQTEDTNINSWSPTASPRLLKSLIADESKVEGTYISQWKEIIG